MYLSVDDFILLFLLQVPLKSTISYPASPSQGKFPLIQCWSATSWQSAPCTSASWKNRWKFSRNHGIQCNILGFGMLKAWGPNASLGGLVVLGISTGKPGKQKHNIFCKLGCSMVFVRISINLKKRFQD